MQSAETVLEVLRERGRRGLPCDELYRQLFNPQLYLLAYGRIYSNKGDVLCQPPGAGWLARVVAGRARCGPGALPPDPPGDPPHADGALRKRQE